jgi:hypothetical protein
LYIAFWKKTTTHSKNSDALGEYSTCILPSGKKLGTLVWSFRRKIGGGDIPKKIG